MRNMVFVMGFFPRLLSDVTPRANRDQRGTLVRLNFEFVMKCDMFIIRVNSVYSVSLDVLTSWLSVPRGWDRGGGVHGGGGG